ncbi:nucleotidyltransferase family protein [Nocardioides sp. Leaf307]|uniref:nucleotidyltransferase family protein n=1 Tax=Nocardioides sp. Leaf307 TaxID=1736331 RepID=UPI0007033E37|nr:nucleotidyltransferase family protein [Nocardioides sp. Leaf307]KQQ42944.1 hypothetical protein ASF50_02715 [Nocardioides sp. Leaf307]
MLLPLTVALGDAGHPVATRMRQLQLLTAARQLAAGRDLQFLATALDDAGLPWALLKGPVLADVVFSRPRSREFTDLDVLVAPLQVDAAVRALCEAGATLMEVDWDHVNAARTAELGLTLPHGTVLDLHWSLVNLGRTRDAYRLSTRDLLDRRVTRTVAASEVATLDDLDMVLHTALHACLSGGHQLRWLLDVQQCLRWIDRTPQDLAVRAHHHGVTVAVRAVLDNVVTQLDPTCSPWADALAPGTAWNALLRRISRRSPPSAPSVSSRTARSWYAATRPTTAASAHALARTARLSLLHLRRPWPAGTPRAASLDDAGYARWVEVARQEALHDEHRRPPQSR